MDIGIVENHVLVSESLSGLVKELDNNNKPRVFKSAEELLAEHFEHWRPQLLIVDLMLTGMTGLELIEKIKPILPSCKFIILTSISDVYTVKEAMRKGIGAYLTKDCDSNELAEAIEAVKNGHQYVNRALKDKLFSYMFTEEEVVFHLSSREKTVLIQLCQGKTPKEIAYDMDLSIHTIQHYLKNLMRKFKVNRTTDLVVFAIQKGMYNPITSK